MSKLIPKVVGLTKDFVVYSKPHLALWAKYARVELAPPTPGEFGAVKHGFKKLIHSAKTGEYKQLTVREAWLNTLVGIEIWMWFFIGECIGRRHIIGYDV